MTVRDSSLDSTGPRDDRWDRCRDCGHYRLEHAPLPGGKLRRATRAGRQVRRAVTATSTRSSGGTTGSEARGLCEAVEAHVLNPTAAERCFCPGWLEPATHPDLNADGPNAGDLNEPETDPETDPDAAT